MKPQKNKRSDNVNRAAWESYEQELFKVAKRYYDESEIDRLKQAVEFGAYAHHDQTRVSGEPYITHPLAVAALVAKIQIPIDGVIAAVLHDVMEDCDINQDELASQFGGRVASLVSGVSKLKNKDEASRLDSDARSLQKLVASAVNDPLVLIIKIADRLHNTNTLGSMQREKQIRIAKQTEEIYIPIAQRLGLYSWAEILEDVCLKIIRPETYRVISQAIKKDYDTRKHRNAFAAFTNEVEQALADAGIKASVTSRTKKIAAIYKKIKKTDKHLNNVKDIFGVRIIVEDSASCYQALGVIHTAFKPKYNELKDYIAVPKSNNYQSIHTKINHDVLDVVDIQIRDKKMDEVAANGIAAHWKYKSELDKNYSRFIRRLSEFEITDEAQQYSKHISESAKTEDKMVVYTPKNLPVDLPHGSTALDFAYYIHTEVGRHAQRAEINGRYSSLYDEIKPGDVVRIKTSMLVQPKPEWLKHVVSARARSSINTQLRELSMIRARKMGRELIRTVLRKYKVEKFDLTRAERQQIAEMHGVSDWRELVSEVGRGRIDVNKLVYEVIFAKGLVEGEPIDHEIRVALEGESGKDFLSCFHCYPVPGDITVGVLMPERGLIVHTENCSLLKDALDNGMTKVNTQWGDTGDNHYPTGIYVATYNRPRVLASLASAVADCGSNIEAASVTERGEGNAEIFFKIMVSGRQQLADIMRRLRATGVVLGISRSRQK